MLQNKALLTDMPIIAQVINIAFHQIIAYSFPAIGNFYPLFDTL